jgi:hypothetical protein
MAAVNRSRTVYRLDRISRHQCSLVHLRQPPVRPPARLGAGADLKRTYVAGAIWPPIFEQVIANYGWRQAMLWYALAEIVVVAPLTAIYFRAPEVIHPAAVSGTSPRKSRVLGWPLNAVFAMMCGAGDLCCIPMAMPQGHLVAFCSDLGISRSMGALMLSILLGTAFVGRQIWGSDRIGGLATVLIG